MSPATLSLCALLAVIFLSLTSRINVGILAVALAFPVGIYSAGWKPDAVLGLCPVMGASRVQHVIWLGT